MVSEKRVREMQFLTLKMEKEGLKLRNMSPLETGKGKVIDSYPEPSERNADRLTS